MSFFSVVLRDNSSKGSSYDTEHCILSSHYSGRNRTTMRDNGLQFNSCRCFFLLLLFVSLFVCSFVLHEEGINGRIHSTVEKLIYAIYMIALFVICAGRNDSSHILTTASKKSFHRMNKYLVALLISQFYWHSCWKLLSTGHVSLSFFPRLLRQTYSVPQNDSRLSGPYN